MSKESGIVVPAVGFLYSLMPARTEDRSGRRRVRLALVTASIIGLYLAFRVVIFGPNFAAYGQDGYMFLGAWHYQDSQDLPTLVRYVNFAENVVKNALTPVLPVFAEGGALLTRQTFFALLPVIASTVLLFGFSLRRDLTRLQWIAVMVMLVNAVAHYALFRFRLQYMAHAAFCLFVAGSPILAAGPGARNLKPAIRALAVIALGGSLVWTSYMVDEYRQQRDRALEMLQIDGVQRFGPVVEEVLEQYR